MWIDYFSLISVYSNKWSKQDNKLKVNNKFVHEAEVNNF